MAVSQMSVDPNSKIAPNGMDTTHFKCLRSQSDGSMYYGEVAYVRKEGGQLLTRKSPDFEKEVTALPKEQRVELFEQVRHGYGL